MPMTIKSILATMSKPLVVESVLDAPTPFVVTPMFYPNGDSINLYFRRDGKRLFASDEGTTFDVIADGPAGVPDDRRRIIKAICNRTEVEFDGTEIRKPLRQSTIAEDCLVLCQAISTISGLYYQQERTERSKLPREIERVLKHRVKSKREYVRNWRDQRHDPDGAFKVDYHFNGQLPARNLFYVTTGNKALLVTAVVHFLRSHGIKVPTLSVVDHAARIEQRQLERLQFASEDIVFGLKGHEKKIVKFALGE